METRLKLVFRSQKLKLALKAAIFAGLLMILKLSGFSVVSVGLFLIGSSFLYASPLFKTVEMLRPFLVLSVLAFLSVLVAPERFATLLAICLGALFYLLIGIKSLVFIRRTIWYRVLNICLAYQAFLLFFYYAQAPYLARAIPLFIVLVLILEDFLKNRVAAWFLSFVLLELSWAIAILPIGFLSGANLALAAYFVAVNLTNKALDGSLSKRAVLADATLFVSLLLVILAFARWSL